MFRLEDYIQRFFIVFSKNYVKAYFRMFLCKNLSLGTFLGCSYFFTKSAADVLINSVLWQNTACISYTITLVPSQDTYINRNVRRGASTVNPRCNALAKLTWFRDLTSDTAPRRSRDASITDPSITLGFRYKTRGITCLSRASYIPSQISELTFKKWHIN